MDSEPQSKRLKLSSFSEELIQITERFSTIKTQIDIDAETLLLRIHNESMAVGKSSEIYHLHIQAINDTRANLISEIEAVSKFLLDKHSKMHQGNIIRDSRSEHDLFTDQCLYLDADTVMDLSSKKYRLGLLIKSNFNISETQAQFLHKLVRNFKNTDPKANKLAISLNEFVESFYLHNKVIQSINTDHYILDVKGSQFSEITQLKISHDNSSGFLSITSGYKWKTKFSNLKILQLVNLNIKEIDNGLLASDTLEELDLSCNSIKSIKKGSFINLNQLKILILCSNNLCEIEQGSFDNLFQLEELDLSSNHLTKLKDRIFLNLNKLTRLHLSDNFLIKIKSKSLEGLTSLRYLDLRVNECTFEHGVLDNMTNLNVLLLAYQNMVSTTKDLSKLSTKNLRELYFTSNVSLYTPLSWLKSHINLHKLSLQMVQATIHKSVFENFSHLQELHISHTTVSLTKIPPNLVNLKKITFLEVDFTQKSDMLFTNVPPGLEEVNLLICEYRPGMEPRKMLKNIRNVKRISFTNKSAFKNIFDYSKRSEVTGLVISEDLWTNNRCITELDLTGNNINTYQIKSLKGLDSLEKLILKSNKIGYIQKGVFSSIKHVKYLDLSINNIELIDKDAFEGFCKLEHLDMSNNEMKEVHKDIFSDLCELKRLELSSWIDRIDGQIFKNLKKLEYLDIFSNNIERLDDSIFSDLPNLKYLNLDSNEIEEINSSLFRGMPLLSELDLSCNNIKSIGNSLCELVNLEKLRLNYNKIQNFDLRSLSKLEKLKLLDLVSNKIKEIEAADLNWFCNREPSPCEILLRCNPVYKLIHPIRPFNCKFN